MRSLIAVVLLICGCQLAVAADEARWLDLRSLTLKEIPQNFYAGLGAGLAHHTGYVPNTRFHAESWVGDGKAFAGFLLTDQVRLESAYHYLGRTTFPDGGAYKASEQTHALAASALLLSPTLPRWAVPSALSARLFARFGGAYKWIEHNSALGRFDEGGISYVAGGGIEIDLTKQLFFRFEYEYLSKIASGTARAVNVQHTPLTLSLGGRF